MTPIEEAFHQLQEHSVWIYGCSAIIFFSVVTIVTALSMQAKKEVLLPLYHGSIAGSLCLLAILVGIVVPGVISTAEREAVSTAVRGHIVEKLGAENMLILGENFHKGYTVDIAYKSPHDGVVKLRLRYDTERSEMVTLYRGTPLSVLVSENV